MRAAHYRRASDSHSAALSLLVLVLGSLAIGHAPASGLDEQRAAFIDVYDDAERGHWQPVEERRALLADYALWPDLEAAYLRTRLDDRAAVRAFLESHGELKPARDLRYRFARHLADRDAHDEFLELYREHYADAGDAELDCLAARAWQQSGDEVAAAKLGRRLWLVGHSQVKTCDPLFSWMRGNGHLTPALLRERLALALDNGDYLLARYLARSLGDQALADANGWLRARGNPESFLAAADISRQSPAYQEQLAYAARRLAVSDPLGAYRHWSRLRQDMDFGDGLDRAVARDIALWATRRRLPQAEELVSSLDPQAVDNGVLTWVIRNALRDEDWARVVDAVDALEGDERDREEWRFWRAVALENTGAEAEAMLVFATLARQRSYYGFLAADRLDVDYALASAEVEADENVIAGLAAQPSFVRARELYYTGLDGRARSEWNEAVRDLDDDTQAQAALLAQRWNWSSRAIAMAARAGRFDSLDLRYPLPHRDEFRESAQRAGIAESWAYGVARSESIFMRDIRSRAGAIGLMQLMPATGRSTAREIRLPYRGIDTLIDPASNIELGATYLGKMHERFGRHPAVATAAYNAGPVRVAQWLPDSAPIDARVWVETIPFDETRDYVRRVLTSDVIFAWRLTGAVPRLSERLPVIAPQRTRQTASAQ